MLKLRNALCALILNVVMGAAMGKISKLMNKATIADVAHEFSLAATTCCA